jgi:hypothetical protein
MFSRVLPKSYPKAFLAPWCAVLTAGFPKVWANIHAIKKFSAAVEPIKGIRHANEHGLDFDARTKLKPEVLTHSIPGLGEFTMVRDQRWFSRVNGVPLIGNVELRPIYQATKEFEKVALSGKLRGRRFRRGADSNAQARALAFERR